MYFRKTDTTVASSLRDGSLVGSNVDSGGIVKYLANDSTDRPIGVCRLRVTATDTSSWQGAPFVPVEVPVESMVEWRIDVDTTGGAADSDIGHYFAVDTSEAGDSESTRIDISDTINPRVFMTGRESATAIYGVLINLAGTFTNDTTDT